MGGGGTDTKTESTVPNNPMVDSTTTKLLGSLQGQMDKGTAVFNQSLYPGMSGQTQQGVNSLMSASGQTGGLTTANNWASGVANSGGYNPALSGAQSGVQQYLQESQADAPGYAAMRAKAGDDTLRDVNSMFTGSGRFGSGSHVGTATESLGNVYAGMDNANYESRLGRMLGGNQALAGIGQTAMGNAAGAAGMLPGLYQSGLIPGQTQLAAGQIMDADALARRQGDNDLFRRQNDSGWATLGNSTSILAGNAGNSGTTTTSTQPQAPWWQQALGAGAVGSGIYKNIWGA